MPKYIVDTETKEYKEVILCKHCIYYRDSYNDWDVCELYDKATLEDDYCSKAERKERNDV